jgi:hypothetical protein
MRNTKAKIVVSLVIFCTLIGCSNSTTTNVKATRTVDDERYITGDAKIKLEDKIHQLELWHNNVTINSHFSYKKIDITDDTITLTFLLRGGESDVDLTSKYKIIQGDIVEETSDTYSSEFNDKLLAYLIDNDINSQRKTFSKKDMVREFESAIFDYANKTGDFNFEYTHRDKNSNIDLTRFTFTEKTATKNYPHVVDITGTCIYDDVKKTVTVEAGYDSNYKRGHIISTTGLDKSLVKKKK